MGVEPTGSCQTQPHCKIFVITPMFVLGTVLEVTVQMDVTGHMKSTTALAPTEWPFKIALADGTIRTRYITYAVSAKEIM